MNYEEKYNQLVIEHIALNKKYIEHTKELESIIDYNKKIIGDQRDEIRKLERKYKVDTEMLEATISALNKHIAELKANRSAMPAAPFHMNINPYVTQL